MIRTTRRRAPSTTGGAAAFPERFWSVSPGDALAALSATPEGLSTAEAARRLAAHGPNHVAPAPRRRILARLGRRLAEPLVAMLVIAAAISGASGDWVGFGLILLVLAASSLLDVFQEHRAETAAEALKRSVAIRCRVRRDGAAGPVAAEDIVPGDVVELQAGGLVPADGLVLASQDAHVNEALLTGEPYPVAKRPGPGGAGDLAEAQGALFGGTALVSGEATMLVVATGARTRFGGIAAALRSDEPPNAFERGLHRLGLLILRLTVFLLLFVLLAQLVSGRPALDAFLFAVALAVGLTPELLPMVTTVTLSRGALRMAARQVVVKRLAVIHDLGAMDVLCTDKTGTLTEARITLAGHPGAAGAGDVPRVLALAAVNSRFGSGLSSPLDEAILARAEDPVAQGWTRIADLPFDFERRRASVLAAHEGRRLLIVKGAPEEILARCAAMEDAEGHITALSAEDHARLQALHEAKAAQGLRCLGIAWRAMEGGTARPTADDERGLTLAGFCTFADPPRAGAAEAIARLRAAGVRVKIVSGDAAPALRHLVEVIGLPAGELLTGEEVARLSEPALAMRVRRADLFARVSPDQKTRIIRALQAHGHVVGFLGDGINDAPAIHAADAGLSVESATDVARAAADLILLAPDLGVIADGVAEGRRTYANIMKYVRMGTSSNFGNMLSTALASLFIPFLPLTPVQVLLNNLLYDLSETGIPFDAVDRHAVARPHGWDMAAIRRYTLVMGPLSSAFDLATFAILLLGFHAAPAEFRTAWFVESMVTQILVIFLIRAEAPVWKAAGPHPVLVATSLGALAAALALALSPPGQALGFVALPVPVLLAVLTLSAAYLAAAEGLKRLATARPRGRAWRAPFRRRLR